MFEKISRKQADRDEKVARAKYSRLVKVSREAVMASPLDLVSGTPSWDKEMQSAREDIKSLLRAAGAR
jgi:hypothetical protein